MLEKFLNKRTGFTFFEKQVYLDSRANWGQIWLRGPIQLAWSYQNQQFVTDLLQYISKIEAPQNYQNFHSSEIQNQ